MGNVNERDRSTFDVYEEGRAIKHSPGVAHPRAEDGTVRSRLMMRVVAGVLDGLRLRQPADGQDAEHKENRENFQNATPHRTHSHNFGVNGNPLV
jgi:hypothetical protein